MNALLVKMSSLGDIVHTLPAVDDATRRGVRFDWVVEEDYRALPALLAGVDAVLPVAFRRWRRSPLTGLVEARRFGRRLRERRYDLALDAQGLVKSAAVGCWARAGERVGFDFGSIRERPAALGYCRRVAVQRREHAITRTRALFAAALGYAMPTTMPRFGLAARPPHGNRVLLAHGATWTTKIWPEPYWIDVVRRVAAAGLTPVMPWLDDEKRRVCRIAAAVPEVEICPPMDLAGIVRLTSGVRGVIGVDSGIAHLAAALGRPTVMLFGPTDPRLTGCRGRYVSNLSASIGCAPCQSRQCRHWDVQGTWSGTAVEPACLASLDPGRVWSALCHLMACERADGAARRNRPFDGASRVRNL